jgi:outer membrane protein TolC
MKRILLLIALFSLPAILFAQSSYQLTIDNAVDLALKNAKSLKLAESKITAAQARTNEANAQLYPTLRLVSGYARLSEVEPFKINFQGREFEVSPTILNNYQIRLGLQYPIFTGFRLENNAKMMELNTKASQEDYETERAKTIFDVKNAYWSIKNLELSLQSLQENIRQVQAHLQDIENFYKNGLTTENEVLKVKVQLSNLELTKIDLENAIRIGKINLCILLGLPTQTDLVLISQPEFQEKEFSDLNKLLETAYKQRPELLALTFRKEASQKVISMAKSGWLPQISFSANYQYNRPNQRLMPAQDKFYGTWDIGFTISYDIWNWMTTKYQTQQAEESYRQAEISYQQLKDAINMEVSQNYFAFIKAKEKINVAKQSVQQAEENYRVTNEKFKNGVVSSSELLDAEVALLNAKVAYNNSILEYEIAKIKLEKSINNFGK